MHLHFHLSPEQTGFLSALVHPEHSRAVPAPKFTCYSAGPWEKLTSRCWFLSRSPGVLSGLLGWGLTTWPKGRVMSHSMARAPRTVTVHRDPPELGGRPKCLSHRSPPRPFSSARKTYWADRMNHIFSFKRESSLFSKHCILEDFQQELKPTFSLAFMKPGN